MTFKVIKSLCLGFIAGVLLLVALIDGKPTSISLAVHSVSSAGSSGGKGDIGGDSYGGTDVNVITQESDSDFPKVTQAESVVWANGDTVVVVYNDTRDAFVGPTPTPAPPGTATPTPTPNLVIYMGVSYSLDGGTTFTRVRPSPFTGHGRNYGDPILVYNVRLKTWFAGAMVTGCDLGSGNGWGLGLWTSSDGISWVPGVCAHNNILDPGQTAGDDRASMWVDNNPGSAYYGRMYISWNDYTHEHDRPGISVIHSKSDDGDIWNEDPVVRLQPIAVQNAQITGSRGSDGRVFVVGFNPSFDVIGRNYIWRSTNGGVNWTPLNLNMPDFRSISTYVCGRRGIENVWRYDGRGQPGVGPNNVIHYAWGAGGAYQGDPGDIYYIRSTDNGNTWSVPRRLDNNAPNSYNNSQWMPGLAVTEQGAVLVSWYDRSNVPQYGGYQYQYMGRLSTDNGATWGAIEPISDPGPPGYIPEPTQTDNAAPPCFAGDYDYQTTQGNTIYTTWTDGRRSLHNPQGTPVPQMDVFFDKTIATVGPTATACPVQNYTISQSANATMVPGTNLLPNSQGYDIHVLALLPFPFYLYGQPYHRAVISENGNIQFASDVTDGNNVCLPNSYPAFGPSIFALWDELDTVNAPNANSYGCPSGTPCGIYTSISGNAPNRIFNIEWRACQPDPPPNPEDKTEGPQNCGDNDDGVVNFEVRLYESMSGSNRFDIIYDNLQGHNGGSSTIGVMRDTAFYSEYSCDLHKVAQGYMLTVSQQACNSPAPPCGVFVDVPNPSTFSSYIYCLTCGNILSGYQCGGPGEQCNANYDPYFRPNYTIYRGQLAKIVSNSANFTEDPGGQIFEDVPPGPNPPRHPFYDWINRLANRGLIGGYDCSGPGEPCGPNNLPYFRAFNNATRGQIAKIVSNAADLDDTFKNLRYTDVPQDHPFYIWVMRLSEIGAIGGYPCGGVNPQTGLSEPCDDQYRPYFRPYNEATRGQTAKIVTTTFFVDCTINSVSISPGSPANPTGTPPTVTYTPTPIVTGTVLMGTSTPLTTPTIGIPTPVSTMPQPVPSVPVPVPTGYTTAMPSPSAPVTTTITPANTVLPTLQVP